MGKNQEKGARSPSGRQGATPQGNQVCIDLEKTWPMGTMLGERFSSRQNRGLEWAPTLPWLVTHCTCSPAPHTSLEEKLLKSRSKRHQAGVNPRPSFPDPFPLMKTSGEQSITGYTARLHAHVSFHQGSVKKRKQNRLRLLLGFT